MIILSHILCYVAGVATVGLLAWLASEPTRVDPIIIRPAHEKR
jgi:hypothetical protein